MNVDVFAGGNVFLGEADDLAEFVNRFSLANRHQGELVPHADPARQLDAQRPMLQFQSRLQRACGHGNVIFRPKMHSHLR